MKEEALKLADWLEDGEVEKYDIDEASAMIRRLVEELDKQGEPVAWMIIDVDNGKSLQFKENKFSEINIPLYTAPKELSDEELNKAFDYYCETDEGVLRFNYELRDEWKKEQLSRWKESFKKAREK